MSTRSDPGSDRYDLHRFVAAQDEDGTYQRAVRELRRGSKLSHWMWFVFPQIAGLGRSPTEQYFAISSLSEARAYLRHPVLGPRLVECAGIVAATENRTAEQIFGGIDAVKLRSSMTLFHLADPAQAVFGEVLDRFFDGERDDATVVRRHPVLTCADGSTVAGRDADRKGHHVLELDGCSLTVADIARVAAGGLPVHVASLARAAAARAHADQTVARRPVYGRSTGVGGNRLIPLEDPAPALAGDPALALLRSHASSLGPLRSPERIRASLVIRLNQLAGGGSGVDPEVIDGLARMLRADALPPIRELGGVGTGDLAALATTALALLGEMPTSEPFDGPVGVGIGDALPLLSSNAATIADAALAGVALRDLALQSLTIAAVAFAGVGGNPEAFSTVVEQVTPFPGSVRVCRIMRDLVDSQPGARIQDPYALRALPQVHGPLLDALDRLDEVVTRLANTPSENPVFLPEAEVAHHGGFHMAYLAQALDGVRLGLAQAAQLSLSRLSMLCDPAMTGLPAFLGDGRPGASGVMTLEYVAASALSSLRALATPASLQTVTLSHGVEEDASFASLAARQALDAVPAYREVLASELVAAVRCVRTRNLEALVPPPLTAWLARCDGLDRDTTDRDLTGDLLLAESLLTPSAGDPPSPDFDEHGVPRGPAQGASGVVVQD